MMTEQPRKYKIEISNSEAFLSLERGEIEPAFQGEMEEHGVSKYAVRHAILKRDALNLLKMNLALHDELVMTIERLNTALEKFEELQPGDDVWPLPHEEHNATVSAEVKQWLELALEKLNATESWTDRQPISKYLASLIGVQADE